MTRCKFQCNSVTLKEDTQDVQFSPVISDENNAENTEFWKWTPSGSLEFSTINKNVKFEPGKEYYLDITEAVQS